MKEFINVEIESVFEIDKESFQEYLLNEYVAYDKQYRPELSVVLYNYLSTRLEECYDSMSINYENISNIYETIETLDKWANEYLDRINFNE